MALPFFRLLTDYVERQNLSTARLLELVGEPIELAHGDEHGRVPFGAFQRACAVASEQLNEPCLGLKLGQAIRPGHLGTHGHALMNCANALELTRQSARYSSLTIDACHNVVEHRGDALVRVLHSNLPPGSGLGRTCEELQHAIALSFARWITGRDEANPMWVSFSHAKPADVTEYQALFRCELRFSASEVAIAYDARLGELPLPNADPQIRRVMEDMCEQLDQRLGSALEPSWLASARRVTLDAFRHGMPAAAKTAVAVGMDEETFKRSLMARGLTYRSFVDELRHGLAVGYIRDPAMSLVDTAYLLGFSEQSAFQRAFKRWTGLTPGEYRRSRT